MRDFIIFESFASFLALAFGTVLGNFFETTIRYVRVINFSFHLEAQLLEN